MPPLSNSQKQARHRKKEALQKFAEQCFRDAQMGAFQHGAKAQDMLAQIKQMAELPSGWTDQDYQRAIERIEQLRMDLVNADNDLECDVFDSRGVMEKFGGTSEPGKLRKDTHQAVEDTQALASHLISSLELTQLSNGERAAALLEAMRHVGRSLANERPLRISNANTVCLSTLPPQYRRPAWFAPEFAKWIAFRLGRESLKDDLGKKIIDYKFDL